jgi:hypothetical protein
MPCRAYLTQLREIHDELDELGVDVVAVGPAADYQAEHIQQKEQIPFPLLLDPDKTLYAAIDLGRMRYRDWVRPKLAANYLRAARRARQGRMSAANIGQLPGLILLDPAGTIVWIYKGELLGDYPPIPELLAEVRRHVGR